MGQKRKMRIAKFQYIRGFAGYKNADIVFQRQGRLSMKARWDMKKLRGLFPLVALAAFVVLSTAVVLAEPIPTGGDPVIRSGGGTDSIPITSSKFTIVTPTGFSPTDGTPCILIQGGISTSAPECIFSNDIERGQGLGTTINALIFLANQTGFSGSLSCALSTAVGGQSPWFTQCAATPAGGPVVRFFGGPGIPFGQDFSLGFRGFNANAAFQVTAVAPPQPTGIAVRDLAATNAPEPGTLALFASGIGALLVRRKSRAG